MSVDELIKILETNPNRYRATYFVSETLTIKVTRQHGPDKRFHRATYIVSVGRPNYRERDYIRRSGGIHVGHVLYDDYK